MQATIQTTVKRSERKIASNKQHFKGFFGQHD